MAEIMHLLNRRFLDWCRLHTINPGQTYIGRAQLHQEDWAELRLKAYMLAGCLQLSWMCAYRKQQWKYWHGSQSDHSCYSAIVHLDARCGSLLIGFNWWAKWTYMLRGFSHLASQFTWCYVIIVCNVWCHWCFWEVMKVCAHISTSCWTPCATEQLSISEAENPRNPAALIMATMMQRKVKLFF